MSNLFALLILKIVLFLIPVVSFSHSQDELIDSYNNKSSNYHPRTKHFNFKKDKFTNHLIFENSPYLLQHAHNPVNWYIFGDEAFNLAKQQNKLIFLSIGYATCHWCHVMENESFEDLEVAKILNKNFISIKVDREILPDVDKHFMDISKVLTGKGGWPLNVVLTPNGDGFFAGTYFPKNDLIANLQNLRNIWKNDKQRIFEISQQVKDAMATTKNLKVKLPNNLQVIAVNELLENFDEFDGGFGDAPKFPNEAQLLMLIDEQIRNPSQTKLTAITTTLDAMASGGFYDIIAGGFHRYTTDTAWKFPHFEKMLYNQAQLSMVYIKAYKLTKNETYKLIATQTIDYVLREMKDKNGGFYTATDADSEGEEGAFFIWSVAEMKKILGVEFAKFEKYFDLSHNTEFADRHIIRYRNISELTNNNFIEIAKLTNRLYLARQDRSKPFLDNKILLSWNSLFLKALVEMSSIDNKYLTQSQELANFLIQDFYTSNNKKLQRVKINNTISQEAIFVDYSYFADALLDLFDSSNEVKYLHLSKNLTNIAIDKFWDIDSFGFRLSNNFRINNKNKDIYDGAIFNPNGVAYNLLNKLAVRIDGKYKDIAQNLLSAFSQQIIINPSIYPGIVGNLNGFKNGYLRTVNYGYNGKIKIKTFRNKITINIAKGWHINAHKVLQDGLIATNVDVKSVDKILYPTGDLMNLGFSEEKINTYKDEVVIDYKLKNSMPVIGILNLQACSDEVCLPPQSIKILLNYGKL